VVIKRNLKNSRTPEEWKKILEGWRKSNLSVIDYCKEKNIKRDAFYKWKKRINPSLDKESFTRALEKWTNILADWKKSGLQKTIYCREKGIDCSVFLRWQKKLNPLWKPVWKKAIEEQSAIVEDWRQTDLSTTDYCKEKNIKRATFFAWKRREGLFIKGEAAQRTLKKWTNLIEEWRKSELSRNAYCKKKRIHSPSFYKWEKRLNPSRKSYRIELLERQAAIVEGWKKSGLSRHAYCLENELTSSFYQWEKKHNPSTSRKTAHEIALEKWTAIIEDWKKSGLSRNLYCKKRGMHSPSFYRWEKKLNPFKSPQPSSELEEKTHSEPEAILHDLFMPFALNSSLLGGVSSPAPRIELILSQGHRLYLEGTFDWKKLADWLAPLLKR